MKTDTGKQANDGPDNGHRDWSERARRLDRLLDEALDLDPLERDSFLEALTTSEPEIGAELRQLVDYAELEAPLLEDSARALDLLNHEDDATASPGVDTRLGHWQIIEPLGAGGMARVYLAERDDGTYSQRAALKILRWELQTPESERRFANERQILADLDHESIAHLLDGGVTAQRLPWFAMEWIDGVAIDHYCAERSLGLTQRLHLFLDVCKATSYAHNRLIIHRDIKPSNILVSRDGRPKLLDFGIAKDLDPEQEATDPTRYSLGTPRYSAPEQVSGARLSPATDVWALGVLLFELLTGSRLFEDTDAAALYHRESSEGTTGRHLEPPSVRARRTAGSPVPPARLTGELDLIIGRALAHDPADRYSNAGELADDLERYLGQRPILAAPPSGFYVAKKFARRHRLALGIATAALAAVVTLSAAFTIQLQRERDIARQESQRTERVKNFLVELFQEADPAINQGRELTARQLVDRGRERLDDELAEDPSMHAEMNLVLGDIFSSLGEPDVTVELMAEGIDLARAASDTETQLLAQLLDGHADALRVLGRYDEAEQRARESLAVTRAVFPQEAPEIPLAINQLGLLLAERGEYEESRALLREGLALTRESLGDHEYTARLMSNLGLSLKWAGAIDEAESLYRESLAMRRRVLPPNHPDLMLSLDNLGVLLGQSGRFKESEAALREALDRRIELLGADHPDIALNLNNLASLFQVKGDLAAAEEMLERATSINEEVFGAESLRTATNLCNLANIRSRRELGREALPLWRRCLEIRRTALGEEHPETARAMRGLAQATLSMGDVDGALATALAASELAKRAAGDDALLQIQNNSTLAEALYRSGQLARAEAELRDSLETASEVLPEDHSDLLTARLLLALVLRDRGADQEATALIEQTVGPLEERFNDQNVHLYRLIAAARSPS